MTVHTRFDQKQCTYLPNHSTTVNDNEEELHPPQIIKTDASPSDAVQCHTQNNPFCEGGVLLLYRGIQLVCSKPRRQGIIKSENKWSKILLAWHNIILTIFFLKVILLSLIRYLGNSSLLIWF